MIIFKAKFYRVISQTSRLKIVFTTKEELDSLVLQQLIGTDGWLAFNEDEFKKEVEKAMADRTIGVDAKGKSNSQKFRGVLFTIWNNSDDTEKRTFEQFYDDEYKKIIEHYKNKYLK